MPERWRHIKDLPDGERAKTLALILGCILVGVLYALGGIAIYLRRNVLASTPIPMEHTIITRAPQAAPEDVGTVVGSTPTPESGNASPDMVAEPSSPVAPTLYPTMTSALPETSSQVAQPTVVLPTQTPESAQTPPPDPGPATQNSEGPTATLYPTATPRTDTTNDSAEESPEPPAPPTREGR